MTLITAAKLFVSTSVLFLGDSHVIGQFGITLDQRIRDDLQNKPQATLHTVGVCGATAGWFNTAHNTSCGMVSHDPQSPAVYSNKGKTPKASQLLSKIRPALTIVELGTNYGPIVLKNGPFSNGDRAYLKHRGKIKSEMRQLARQIHDQGSKCIWISLPDTRQFKSVQADVLNITQEAVGDWCTVIDSTQLTQYPESGGDGIHYSSSEGAPSGQDRAIHWANQVFMMIRPALDEITH